MRKATRKRSPDYLLQRPGSKNWYVRLQQREGTAVQKSLGTPDREQAAILAMPFIAAHKQHLLDTRPKIVASWSRDFEPGLHVLPDGGHVMATETTLTFSDAGGKITGTRPNGHPTFALTGGPLPGAREFELLDAAWDGRIEPGPIDQVKPTVLRNSHYDDAIMDTYIKHKRLPDNRAREAREMWRIFRIVVGKPLRDCTREDGRAIVAYLEDQADGDAKSATLRRRMVPLVAAINLAISDGKHKGINPFSSVVPDRKDEEEREAFDDDDVKLIRKNLHRLDANDQLLVRVLATTGMRRGEVFEIDSEKKEDGIRYCTIGTKTPQSLRPVPFPKDLLPYLPAKITGPLITGRKDGASKRLREFLRDIGIKDRDKAPMHSFRHRAAQRLRRAVPDEALREAIGGWADGKKKVSRKYGNKQGRGFPIKMLKAAIDTIGF